MFSLSCPHIENMKRNIYQQLIAWKRSDRRKPLILKGARQVGKTYLLEKFAQREYEDYLYIDFDEKPQMGSFFEEDLDPERILKDLSLYFKKKIFPGKTLLVFDEIQECPNALNSLKYFCQKKNEYHVAAAGSLLGVKLSKGFPVGKVNFLHLKPLSFFEFLDALNETELRELLKKMSIVKALSLPFHHKLIKLLKYYFIVGGMPEAVAHYVENDDLENVRAIQKEILDAYTLDFTKHAPKNEMMKIMEVWNLVPSQLAKENKKFIFTAISKSARASYYEAAVQWLVDAGLIVKSYRVSVPNLPLNTYADRHAFKVFVLDTGLLGAMSGLDPDVLLKDNQLFKEFKGALTENYVTQELYNAHDDDLHYWTSTGIAEVDFITAFKQKIYPLEVKASVSKQKKSLLVYGKKYNNSEYRTAILSRATLRNFAFEDHIVNYPLYAVSLFPRLSRLEAKVSGAGAANISK